ncbi:MAG: hypothetical protein QM811_08870 [Pirellulales bacterium]
MNHFPSLPTLRPAHDAHTLAAEQGVSPYASDAARPDFWPNEETTDEFLEFLHDVHRAEPGPE